MIASVRGKLKGDGLRRRRTPIRMGASLLAAAAFLFGATTVMAATTSATVLDQGLDVPAVVDTTTAPPTTADPAPVDPAPPTVDPAPTVTPLDATPAPAADPPPPVAVDPTPAPATTTVDPAPATTPATTTTTPTATPAPDQLSPVLLAQVNAANADPAAPAKSTADVPPPTIVARTVPVVDVGSAAIPATPPPIGDEPPGALLAARNTVARPAALVPVLLPAVPVGANAPTPSPREEVTASRARPVWNEFTWRNTGSLGGGSDLNLGTRALLAIIGMLPFAPVDGPDRSAPPLTQLALLIPVLGLVAFLFATRPIADPRRRGPQSYRAVALKPG